jgi:hypothetical protein
MYCSIDEAWNSGTFSSTTNLNGTAVMTDNEHFKQDEKNNDNSCVSIMKHIEHCDKCSKKYLYEQSRMNSLNGNMIFNDLLKNNTELITVILVGILIILLLKFLH